LSFVVRSRYLEFVMTIKTEEFTRDAVAAILRV
jgi:hypothetical protein